MNNWGPALIVLMGIAGGVLYSNARISDLKDSINKRLDDFQQNMNKRFDDLHDLLRSEVKRLEERIDHTRA